MVLWKLIFWDYILVCVCLSAYSSILKENNGLDAIIPEATLNTKII